MTVKELKEELSKFPEDMEVCDYEYDVFESVHYQTWKDSNYPYNRPDKKYVCIDVDKIAYCDDTIIEEIKNYLGEEGMKYFTEDQTNPINGKTIDDFDGKYYWEGRQIRNHILDKFPNVVTWLHGYQRFEDLMYKWTKKAVEEYGR